MATSIPPAEVIPHPLSLVDPNARLFTWNGELYRGIHPSRVPFYEELFRNGAIAELVAAGLFVPTVRTELNVEPFGLVLKHRRLPFVSYPFEWSRLMLRDAALLVLDLQQSLARRGLTLQDGHSWNVLWDGAKPVFVDFGSITQGAGAWYGEEEFRAFFTRPLQLMAAGHERLARALITDVDAGIQPAEAALLPNLPAAGRSTAAIRRALTAAMPEWLRRTLRNARTAHQSLRPSDPPGAEASLQTLRDEIEAIRLPSSATDWSGYYDDEFPGFIPDDSWTPKHRGVHGLLRELSPRSVMDIGANRGWFAQLAARQGAAVVACDTDEGCVDLLYQDVRAAGLDVHPVLMDATKPFPGAGVNGSYAPAAVERFRSEVVLALALTHHLVFKRHLGFEQIAALLAAFATRAVVVEFVPSDDQFVRQWMTDRHQWYTLDNFIAALRRHWPRVDVRPSHPAPRVLVVAQRQG